MQNRSTEAQRLEVDYLERLQRALGSVPADQAAEIEQNVRDHIHAAFATESGEISLTAMAAVLEELGPPETLAGEVERPPAPPQTISAPAAPDFDSRILANIFMGYLIVVAGFYIPVLDILLCTIIGYAIVAMSFKQSSADGVFGTAGGWAMAVLVSSVITSILAALSVFSPLFAVLNLPVAIAFVVTSLVTDWKMLSGCAVLADRNGDADLAASCRTARVIWLCCTLVMVVLALLIGAAMGLTGEAVPMKVAHQIIFMFILLPIGWVLGGCFLLRPLWRVKTRTG